ncbi:hypothetical protein [Mesorhizobium sp.]|uniref:hypothetical protein n=1 Tax=Mesorhizobium sp. TaxID=1871066 RepID=UPI000FE830C4|nr:hypothetical protein [Mesorhizobium sp.]RWC26018.1 MAG: hypothetical protein EOS27_26475 [Mesorhizobium sp.]TIX21858.1 MAG: hypothetical protein E5V35_28055 [Mesorhizobium sp.]
MLTSQPTTHFKKQTSDLRSRSPHRGFSDSVPMDDANGKVAPCIEVVEAYRATRVMHQVLLNTLREVTEKEVEFIQWNGTGPV